MNETTRALAVETPDVFPFPREMELRAERFRLDEQAAIAVPANASEHDLRLARFLSAEFSDRHGLGLPTRRLERLPDEGRVIVMGSLANPLVREYCDRNELSAAVRQTGAEGYVLDVRPGAALVAGRDEPGAFHGLQSLRQLCRGRGASASIRGARIRDWPRLPFRGVRLYLPGRESIPFFKRFLKDFMALYKFNKVILEVNAAMRLDRRPELNAGWIEFGQSLNYSRRNRPASPFGHDTNSAHHDTGDFGIVEKDEVAGLVRFANDLEIEVIPEIPSLPHTYYLLTRHPELAEIAGSEWPDTYCPLQPESYALLFDVMDEYIEVMRPRMVHIGHDEWRMPVNVCPRCKDRDPRDLYAEDVRRIYDYLAAKGLRVAMWGDYLLETVRSEGVIDKVGEFGHAYRISGALSPQQVLDRIPKDILIFNWFWREKPKKPGPGEKNDVQLADWGFEQVYGNMTPEIAEQGWERRAARRGIIGGAPSSWAATREFNFGKDHVHQFTGCAALLWSAEWPGADRFSKIAQGLMPAIRRNLSGAALPSDDGDPVNPLDIAAGFNAAIADAPLGADFRNLRIGEAAAGSRRFRLAEAPGGKRFFLAGTDGQDTANLPRETARVPVGKDANSLLFLHACARPAANYKAHFSIYNFPDSADLLGWYEIVFEDGLIETIPLRYGINILEWSWGRTHEPATVCYGADPVDCSTGEGAPLTLWAFEWKNSRFGKAIREVRLNGSGGYTSPLVPGEQRRQEVSPAGNAIVWAALSAVEVRPAP